MIAFKKVIEIRWLDIDVQQHVTRTAYINFSAETWLNWMRSIGYPVNKLADIGLNAVVIKDEIEYHREILSTEEQVIVELMFAGANKDYSRWKFISHLYKADNKLAAKHTTYGAWIDANTRKVVPAPTDFLKCLVAAPKMYEFEIL